MNSHEIPILKNSILLNRNKVKNLNLNDLSSVFLSDE